MTCISFISINLLINFTAHSANTTLNSLNQYCQFILSNRISIVKFHLLFTRHFGLAVWEAAARSTVRESLHVNDKKTFRGSLLLIMCVKLLLLFACSARVFFITYVITLFLVLLLCYACYKLRFSCISLFFLLSPSHSLHGGLRQ